MEPLLTVSREALWMLVSGDRALWEIIAISFGVSLRAILISTPIAIAVAFLLAYTRFPGRRLLISAANALLAVPAVAVGLLLYLMLSRSGPLGDLRLLFTQTAMVIGQIVLSFPLLVAMAHTAIQGADRRAWETALTLGAPGWRAALTFTHEIRFALVAAVVAAFGRIISEVGSSMMVGGNILHVTRNIPTAIALETSKGEFAQGVALGIVLVVLALGLNMLLHLVQGKGEARS